MDKQTQVAIEAAQNGGFLVTTWGANGAMAQRLLFAGELTPCLQYVQQVMGPPPQAVGDQPAD